MNSRPGRVYWERWTARLPGDINQHINEHINEHINQTEEHSDAIQRWPGMIARLRHASWRADDISQTDRPRRPRPWIIRGLVLLFLALSPIGLAACSNDDDEPAATLRIGAIPDQDPEVLQRQFGLVSDYLATELGVDVEYVPVSDYQGAVSGFAVGDLDLVWFGGLTGVQARLEVDGSQALIQRDIDARFTSVFIAGSDVGVEPFGDVAGLRSIEGRSFTFGSESSTSGRLMPQSFMTEAGIDIDEDLTGEVGFSGSHDATIEVVEAGTFEVGALNSQVWDSRVAEGAVDLDRVVEIFRTPTYYDYHWVGQADLDERFGDGFTDLVVAAFTSLELSEPTHAEILELFGAGAFIETENGNYDMIEAVARDIGAIR